MKEINGLTQWLKDEKGINKIELTDLVNYLPEYKLWLSKGK